MYLHKEIGRIYQNSTVTVSAGSEYTWLLFSSLHFSVFYKILNLGTCFSVIIRKVKVTFLRWGSTEVYEKGSTVPWGISTKNWETPLEWSTWHFHGAFWGPTSLDHKRAQGIKVKAKLNLLESTGLGFVRQGDEPCPPLVPQGSPKFFTRFEHSYESYRIGWCVWRLPYHVRVHVESQNGKLSLCGNQFRQCTTTRRLGYSPADTTCKLSNLNVYNHISRKDNLGERWHSPTVVCNPNMATGSVPCDFIS